MNDYTLSVIICAHNPRQDYFERVLKALKSQTLPTNLWELLLIDNASDHHLSEAFDLSWHPVSKHIREEKLGLTPARLKGIEEASSEVLIFVDDDNILKSNYLEVALKISQNYPFIGAWGGQIRPEFEVPPPEWTKPYWKFLAIREFEKDQWSNLLHQHETTPCGAGMCIRKPVATRYSQLVRNDPNRLGLGRTGSQLISCEDSDMAFTACDMGLGTGQFTALELIHLMPAGRLTEPYLKRLMEGIAYSNIILDSFRDKPPNSNSKSLLSKAINICRLWMQSPIDRRLHFAGERGRKLAIQELFNSKPSSTV